MFSRREAAPKQEKASSAPPKDALAALMEGNTPAKKDLKFADEREDSFDYPRGQETGHKQAKAGGRFEQYSGDHSFDHKANRAQGEYEYAPQEPGTFNNIKQGAVKSGTYVKDKSVAGATYIKEKDWAKEKEMAGKAGQATKSGAIYVGSGVAKGAGWLWRSGKNRVDDFRNRPGEKE